MLRNVRALSRSAVLRHRHRVVPCLSGAPGLLADVRESALPKLIDGHPILPPALRRGDDVRRPLVARLAYRQFVLRSLLQSKVEDVRPVLLDGNAVAHPMLHERIVGRRRKGVEPSRGQCMIRPGGCMISVSVLGDGCNIPGPNLHETAALIFGAYTIADARLQNRGLISAGSSQRRPLHLHVREVSRRDAAPVSLLNRELVAVPGLVGLPDLVAVAQLLNDNGAVVTWAPGPALIGPLPNDIVLALLLDGQEIPGAVLEESVNTMVGTGLRDDGLIGLGGAEGLLRHRNRVADPGLIEGDALPVGHPNREQEGGQGDHHASTERAHGAVQSLHLGTGVHRGGRQTIRTVRGSWNGEPTCYHASCPAAMWLKGVPARVAVGGGLEPPTSWGTARGSAG